MIKTLNVEKGYLSWMTLGEHIFSFYILTLQQFN